MTIHTFTRHSGSQTYPMLKVRQIKFDTSNLLKKNLVALLNVHFSLEKNLVLQSSEFKKKRESRLKPAVGH